MTLNKPSFNNGIQLSEGRSSWGSAILLLGLALVGAMIGSYIGLALAIPFYPGSLMEMQEALIDPTSSPSIRLPLFMSQGFATLVGMILIPSIYLKIREGKSINIFFVKSIGWMPVLLTVVIVMTFMVVNSVFIEWNATADFPDFMKGFEQWARTKEDKIAELTVFLTNFESGFGFVVAFVVIAILAPVGEELLFRGFLQNEIHAASKNIHVGIWVSALLFSAIHIQFFGFIPRLLLGALFGYLYYWSGNLLIPIIAHFINNGFTIIALYLHQRGIVDFNIENTESLPLPTVLMFTIITAGLLYYFRNHFLISGDERMAEDL